MLCTCTVPLAVVKVIDRSPLICSFLSGKIETGHHSLQESNKAIHVNLVLLFSQAKFSPMR